MQKEEAFRRPYLVKGITENTEKVSYFLCFVNDILWSFSFLFIKLNIDKFGGGNKLSNTSKD